MEIKYKYMKICIKILKCEKYATIAESTQFPLPWDPTSLSFPQKIETNMKTYSVLNIIFL